MHPGSIIYGTPASRIPIMMTYVRVRCPHSSLLQDLVGALNDRLRARGLPLSTVQTFTKWVPRPGAVTRAAADDAIGRSLRRMKVDSLDLLQFHWWDYGMRAELLEAMRHLADMTREGKIRKLGLTNFDTGEFAPTRAGPWQLCAASCSAATRSRRPQPRLASAFLGSFLAMP